MAGGLFGQKFQYNTKCVVFGGGLVLAYWTLPCRYDEQRHVASAFIFVAAYTGMAWYDKVYQCRRGRLKHRKGIFNDLTGWMKPDPVNGVH